MWLSILDNENKKTKISKARIGLIVLLAGCIYPVLMHFYLLFAGLEMDKRVDDMSKIELWSLIISCSILGGVAAAVSMGVVNFVYFIYTLLQGKDKNKPDHF